MLRFLLAALAMVQVAVAQDLPYVNWENHPVHPVALSPDGQMLAVAHTADNRVQLFDVSLGRPVRAGHVVVGIDPVSVRWRNDGELWAVNHISDSISVINVDQKRVVATLQTADEPFDVVFAGSAGRAFVSASQANLIQVFNPNASDQAPISIPINAEDPRALAVSADGRTVYAAVFESGNQTTIVGGGLVEEEERLEFPPNLVNDNDTPSGGVNPPPNRQNGFEPAITPGLPTPPPVGLIVKRDGQSRWLDDSNGDWTTFISGPQAARSGRVPGWTLIDHDIAVINADTLGLSYIDGLMNIGMALAYNSARNTISLVGTDATNEVRFEPNINGRFLRVNFASAGPAANAAALIRDLNPHLNYATPRVDQAQRDQSLGDPRALVWTQAGNRGYVSGMGSNNVIVIDGEGQRVTRVAPIEVGEGPTGMALDETRARLYVWNHFETSLSVVDTNSHLEIDRLSLFSPLPPAIREGRKFLYGTHETSGLGHVSCASCHVDSRIDRLAWDLGDPSGEMKPFNQNCQTTIDAFLPCDDFHPMKGPMVTQTLQDIIGNEPFHWRGDRDGIEEFNGSFIGLLGDDRELTASEMQLFKDHLATIHFPPNPFRNLDNSLPDTVALDGQVTSGRFGAAGQPLVDGNPQRGLQLYTSDLLDGTFQCASCHTLPTGMAVNGPLFFGNIGVVTGGTVMAPDSFGSNHLGVVSVDGSTNRVIKTPQLRNMYDKVGFEMSLSQSRAGFGFLHDGSVDSLSRFLSAPSFSVENDQDVADLVALMMAFSGSDFDLDNPRLGAEAPPSKDTHAAVGKQLTINDASDQALITRINEFVAIAQTGDVDLVVHSGPDAWRYDLVRDQFHQSDFSAPRSTAQMIALSDSQVLTWTLVPFNQGGRMGSDRDGDGLTDANEITQGSNPVDASSFTLRPRVGLWYNAARSGHGIDIQLAGNNLFATWYTYNDDQSATWYQAVGPFNGSQWQGELYRITWQNNAPVSEIVGSMELDFATASAAEFRWRLGERSGSEPITRFVFDRALTLNDYTGTWYDVTESGWGMTIDALGATRVAVTYFYDAQGQPRWVLGTDTNTTAGQLAFDAFSGFCPDCEATTPVATAAGAVDWRFASSRAAEIDLNVNYPGLADSQWQREGVSITPLSLPAFDPTVF